MPPALHTVMYHYVRDLPRTKYPRIKGMLADDFVAQVDALAREYEMATLESALAFLAGRYEPRRDLCLLTFDDGVAEHHDLVTPVLAERGIEGQFFLITSAVEEHTVAPVHMNHFLMAALDFADYRSEMLARFGCSDDGVDEATARATYKWDTIEVARFKYLFNFTMAAEVRDGAVKSLFEDRIGDEADFARELYVSWEQARAMQSAGQRIGGHTHWHRPVSSLNAEELAFDLGSCRRLLEANCAPQTLWPFSYPYGKRASYTDESVAMLGELGFACSFTTEVGPSGAGAAPFHIRRVDCKNALDGVAV
ncbi:MAG: polysaccharide deacetylase family protein [Bryobacteraceae bacterium]